MEKLKPFFKVVTWDGRGQGGSPGWPEIYPLAMQVEDLKSVVGKLSLPRDQRVCVLGLSNGGRVALEFARRYSSFVSHLIIADTYGELTPLLKLKLQSWLKASEIGGAKLRFDVATPWVFGESFVAEYPELIQSYRAHAETIGPEVTASLIQGAMDSKIELEKISTKTLVLVGEEDLLTPFALHLAMVKRMSDAKLEIIKGGHASLLEFPESIDEFVLPFLKEDLI